MQLQLADAGIRRICRDFGIEPSKRIGRGQFCAVYEKDADTVWKLTIDPIQHESLRDYLRGEHAPVLRESMGYVGEARCGSLYLYQTERLQPVTKVKGAPRKLADFLCDRASSAWTTGTKSVQRGYSSRSEAWRREVSRVALDVLAHDEALPVSLQEAFACLFHMSHDYDNVVLDLQRSNLMVRADGTLVLNDVVCDGSQLH